MTAARAVPVQAEASDADLRARDARLMAAYAAGDAQAAGTLVQLFAPLTLALAQRMLRNTAEAEEIAQEALLRLWKIAPDWRAGEAQISTWIYRVTANLCTDRLRQVRPGPLPDGWDAADPTPGAVAGLIARDRTESLHRAMAQLPDRQRLAVTLRHFEELSNPEIGAIMDLSVEAVESLLSRGRRQLRSDLAGTAGEPGQKEP